MTYRTPRAYRAILAAVLALCAAFGIATSASGVGINDGATLDATRIQSVSRPAPAPATVSAMAVQGAAAAGSADVIPWIIIGGDTPHYACMDAGAWTYCADGTAVARIHSW